MRMCILILLFLFQNAFGQVGVNTTNPLQSLHIAGSTGTLRIESLNSTNNNYNGGDADGDLDPTNDTYPLYVDENGDFTLELITLEGSEEFDAFDDTSLPTSSVELTAIDGDGKITTLIKTYSITVGRASILEVKYILSFDVYLNPAKSTITDNLARRIGNYITITGQTREYGPTMKCYSSATTNSINGTFYNSNTAYITLPSAGSYDVSFYGIVSSGLRSGGGPGGPSKQTYVEFATGNDFVFMRLH